MELWKKINGQDHYSVSDEGRVRNDKSGYIFKPTVRGKTCPYLSVLLPDGNGKYKHWNIHNLVAEAFCPKGSEELVVNHKDGDKFNNRSDNLEWVTRSENDRHAFALGLRYSTSEQIQKAIDSRKRRVRNLTLGTEYNSIAEAGRAIGGRGSSVSKCLSGERETYLGMKFAYAD